MNKSKLKYADVPDEEVIVEARKRLHEIKILLIEIRDLLKAAAGVE